MNHALRVIPYAVYDGAFNMAADEFLMRQNCPCLRFYGWETPTLSFGRNRSGLADIDRDFCLGQGVQAVKRLTGGKTVLHHRELTYAFAAPTTHFPRGALEGYFLIAGILQRGLRLLNIEAQYDRQKIQGGQGNICFLETSSYELTVGGKKIVGNAQRRARDGVLQHGSLPINIDWSFWKRIWRLAPTDRSLEARITAVGEMLDHKVAPLDLALALTVAFIETLGLETRMRDFTDQEKATINERKPHFIRSLELGDTIHG